MRSVALKGLIARPVRTILTTLAIVLGVAMISGALTLTDTMRGGADGLTKAAYDGTDAVVTAKTAFTVESSDYTAKRPTVDASLLEQVRSVPQVRAAVGDIHDEAKIIARDGKPAGDGPYFGVGFDATTPGSEQLTPFTRVEPAPDPGALRAIGERYVVPPGRVHVRIQPPIPPRELMSRHRAARNRFGADEYVPHDEILQTRTDIPSEIAFQQASTRTFPAGIPFRRMPMCAISIGRSSCTTAQQTMTCPGNFHKCSMMKCCKPAKLRSSTPMKATTTTFQITSARPCSARSNSSIGTSKQTKFTS